ncbi:MAG: hypothetical protein HY586_01025, partial [Candidatus Omnitrophica bacterium]|nr:hypothetical protein [Candidatus Omnitrophota bacterium]
MTVTKVTVTFLFAFLFLRSLQAGVYFESEFRSSVQEGVQKNQTYISGAKMKVLTDGKRGWILDLERSKLYDFDLENKTYYEISLQDIS